MPENFLSEATFEDPKVTRIDDHLLRRQQEKTSPPDLEAINNPSLLNMQDSHLACHPAFEKKRQEIQNRNIDHSEKHPPHIFSSNQEDLEKNISVLEQQILEKIQADLDPPSHIPNSIEPLNNSNPPIENIPAQQIHDELQNVTTNAFAIQDQINPDENFDKIKNWLEDTPAPKPKYSKSKIILLSLCTAAFGIFIGALLVSQLHPSFRQTEAADANKAYEQKVEDAYKAYIASRNTPQIYHSDDKDSNGGGPGGGSGSGTISKAGIALAFPAAMQGLEECNTKPDIHLSPLPAGKTHISINAECHADQKVTIEYAESRFTRQLDENGKGTLVLDCFAGDQQDINFHFEDKQLISRKPVTQDLEQITKVALIWSGNIDLNLHAFEYMANLGDKGHIWEQQPSDFKKAVKNTKVFGKGHGFLSTYKAALEDDTNLEVYTFVNTAEQQHGVIKLALHHNTAKARLHKVGCTDNNLTVDYTTTLLVNNNNYKTGQAASILSNCSSRQTLNSRAIQDLIVGK